MTGLVLREATAADLDAAADVLEAAYAQYVPSLPPHVWGAYRAEVRNVRGRLDSSTLILAAEPGRLLGAVTYYPDARREGHVAWPEGWAAFRLLGVHPDGRGQGIGRRLTEECIRRAREARRPAIGLHTTGFMAVARAMYERMGFVRVPALDFRPAPALHIEAFRLDL